MIVLFATLGAMLVLALLGAGVLTWTAAAIAAALAALDFALARRSSSPAGGAPAGTSAWCSVDRAYLLLFAAILLTLLPMPLAATRLAGRERHAQNVRVAEALREAADLGLARRQTDLFAFTRNRAGTMRVAAILIAACAMARLASRLNRRSRLILLGGLLLLGTAIGIAGFVALRFLPQRDTLWWVYPIPHVLPGPVACFVNRNHFAGLMAMLSPPALVLAIHSLRTRRWLLAPLWLFCFLALGAALLASMSRGAFLAWLAGMAAVPVLLCPPRRAVPALALGGILAALTAWAALTHVPALRDRLKLLSDPGDYSVGSRLTAWKDTLSAWRAYPLAGAGANAFRMVYPQQRTSSHSGFRTHAENQYLQMLAEGGVAGTALVALLIAACGLAAVRYARSDDPSRTLLAAAGSGAAVAAAHACTDFALHVPLYALALAILCGINLPPPARAALPRPAWLAALNLAAALALLANEPEVQRMEDPRALGRTTPDEARQALVWAPTHWRAWTRWGHVCRSGGGAQGARYAERCVAQAAEYDPLSYRLWQYLGYVRLDLKDHDGARQAFARARSLRAWIDVPPIPGT